MITLHSSRYSHLPSLASHPGWWSQVMCCCVMLRATPRQDAALGCVKRAQPLSSLVLMCNYRPLISGIRGKLGLPPPKEGA